jgi:hypothetical protein
VLETTNVSRTGLYFVSAKKFFFKGMRLFVEYPYSVDFGAINRDYLAEVVRIKELPNGQYGVAVHLLSTLHLGREDVRGNK